jgi:RNA polymerase sigma-70 factor (family 1)
MKIEDRILYNEIKERNHQVFDALFREYYLPLTKFAESFMFDRTVSEDIVQSFFVSLWENAPRIDIRTSLKLYCYQSVKNMCLNRLRDLKIKDRRNLLYIEAVLQQQDEGHMFDPEILTKIRESIDLLPPNMAMIFKLKYLDGKKNREISNTLNLSENTIKTQLTRARGRIRTMLEKNVSLYFFL